MSWFQTFNGPVMCDRPTRVPVYWSASESPGRIWRSTACLSAVVSGEPTKIIEQQQNQQISKNGGNAIIQCIISFKSENEKNHQYCILGYCCPM